MEDPVVPLERNLYGHPLTGLLWERQFEKVLLETRLGESFKLGMFICQPSKRDCSYPCMWTISKLACETENIEPTWKILMKDVDLGEQTSFLDHVYLGCTQRECQISKDIVANCRDMFESRISAGFKEKQPTRAPGKHDAETISSWSCDMEGHAKKCVERNCEHANKTTQSVYKVATSCMDDHQLEEETGSVRELSSVCSQLVFEMSYLARIGRLDILWSVNKLARAVIK